MSNIVFTLYFTATFFEIVKSLDIRLYFALIFVYFIFNQIMVTILYLQDIFEILEKRYEILIFKIREVYSSINRLDVVWNGQQVNHCYFLLHTNIKKINDIFGLRILLIIVTTMLYVLQICQLTTIEATETTNILLLSEGVIFLVSTYFFFNIWQIMIRKRARYSNKL